MHSVSDDEDGEDITSPVDRGVDRAEIDFVSSPSRAKRNVKAMRRAAASSASHRQSHSRPSKDQGSEDEGPGRGCWTRGLALHLMLALDDGA